MKHWVMVVLTMGLTAGLALGAGDALAAPAAVVEGVQMPAWVERDAMRVPLAAGTELKGGDELRTGAGARIYVKLAEGSLVQLGENASLRLQDLAPQRDGLFKAAMNVLEGAFRFTTDVLKKERRREVNITIRTVTAGIRGTDLWGKSTEDRQIVCLIEGRIEVGAQGEPALTMDQPQQFYQRVKGLTLPVGRVEDAQLAQWAKETAIETGRGAARLGGKWKVTLATIETQDAALTLYDAVRAAGYAATILPAKSGEKTLYHVRIVQLASQADAQSLAGQLRGKFGVVEPKVSG
jgi:hypothetical protein